MKIRKLKRLILSFFLILSLIAFVLVGYFYIKQDQSSEESEACSLISVTFSSIPQTQSLNVGKWNTSKSNAFVKKTDWVKYDEREVFHTSLVHNEGETNSWEIHIGKGSQIVSLRGPFGEAVPDQRDDSKWNDATHLTALVGDGDDPKQPIIFIHQSGDYSRDPDYFPDPANNKAFYSPILEEFWSQETKTYTTISWPQIPIIPTSYKSGIILKQEIKDIGNGVIEVDYWYHNFGTDIIEQINTPWMPIRTSSLPVQLISTPNGKYKRQQEVWGANQDVPDGRENIDDTSGWFIFAKENDPSSPGLGFVFGKTSNALSNEGNDNLVRWGSIDSKIFGQGNKTPFTIIRRGLEFKPGESFFSRHYLIINNVGEIQEIANNLQKNVRYGHVEFTAQTAGLKKICKVGNDFIEYGRCTGTQTPTFYSYDNPVKDAQPIFKLRDTTKNAQYIVYTNDPYELSDKPYDEKTGYLDLLGWAVPSNKADTTCYEYKKLSEILKGTYQNVEAYRGDGNLMVRVSNVNKCASQKCADGTIFGQCSAIKPKYCNNGTLQNKCSTCGCPSNQACQSDGSCKTVTVAGVVCGPMDTNGDNKLTIVDLSNFVKVYGKKCKDNAPTTGCKGKDTNKDGKVTLIDLSNFVKKYGKKSCVN
jgi:hypothetical protein